MWSACRQVGRGVLRLGALKWKVGEMVQGGLFVIFVPCNTTGL